MAKGEGCIPQQGFPKQLARLEIIIFAILFSSFDLYSNNAQLTLASLFSVNIS